jgi:predicted dehydrogenase
MQLNKILFLGLGGAGQRHLRIFKSLLGEKVEFSAYRKTNKTPNLNSDFTINNKVNISEEYGIRLFDSFEESLENKPDLVVISTPSSLHQEIALKAAQNNINIFVEKPFSNTLHGFDEFKNSVIQNKLYFYISFQRRFHPYLAKINKIIKQGKLGKIITANFNVGSYVPEWHPYEDYNELYACRKDLGGGVLLTEIHELDLCYWYFGLPDFVNCIGGKYSNTDIDVEDTANIVLDYSDFSVNVNLSFMQKYNRRDLYIAGTDGYVEWNQIGNNLKFVDYKTGKEYAEADNLYSNDNMFISQTKYILNDLHLSDNVKYLDVAKSTLSIVDAAKQSMNNGKKVRL